MKFPRLFWIANGIELLERFAYYGMYIALTLYLSRLVGFSDMETGAIAGTFSALLYILPSLCGTVADRITFRKALLTAFSLLFVGYLVMGLFPSKTTVITALMFIALGGAFVKPTISGTVSRTSPSGQAAQGFSIFYLIVNVGGFLGKTLAYPLRINLGIQYICLASAALAVAAFLAVFFFYRDPGGEGTAARPPAEVLLNLWRAVTNYRLLLFLLILSGFHTLYIQMYFTLPLYTLRTLGEKIAPEWMVNVNPLMIVLFQLPVTALLRKLKPLHSIMLGVFIISTAMFIFSHRPGVLLLLAGIATIALGEMAMAPRALEFVSSQAPTGQTGVYMGCYYLSSFFGNLFGGLLAGIMLTRYCPQEGFRGDAPLMWYYYMGIGILTIILLWTYSRVVPPPVSPAQECLVSKS
jgi:dipeptide/tripeptide permease